MCHYIYLKSYNVNVKTKDRKYYTVIFVVVKDVFPIYVRRQNINKQLRKSYVACYVSNKDEFKSIVIIVLRSMDLLFLLRMWAISDARLQN